MKNVDGGTKRCLKCGETKAMDDFSKRASAKDGRHSSCRACWSVYTKARRPQKRVPKTAEQRREEKRVREAARTARILADPEKRLARNEARRVWRLANPDKVKAMRARNRARNRERERARAAERYRENAEQERKRSRVWYQENKEWSAAYARGRRALKRAAPGRGVSPTAWAGVVEDSLGLCAYCGERRPLTMDHVTPLIRGGAHDPENVVAACVSCNSSKHDTPLLVWLARRAA